MLHGTLTIVTKIRPSKVKALEALLGELNARIREGEAHPFEGVEGLSFARWGILEPGPDGERLLVFGADFSAEDGRYRKRSREFLERLVVGLCAHRKESGPRAFDAIYRCCAGYPAKGLRKPNRVFEFLKTHSVPYTARQVDFAYRVETAEGMRQLLSLSDAVEHHLNTHRHPLESLARDEELGVERVHQEIQQHLRPLQPVLSDSEWRRRWDLARSRAAWATLLYPAVRYAVALPLVGLCSAIAAVEKKARGLFHRRAPIEPRQALHPLRVLRNYPREPQGPVQNPMIHVATLEPGLVARAALWMTLRSVNLRLLRYVVGLNHIRAIHCARWVLLTNRRSGRGSLLRPRTHRLLFFSNYDGSWESYIDSFVDDPEVREFLVRIWSGTQDFPQRQSSRPFVEPFKAWIQQQQVPTRVWYSAHLHGPAGRVEPSIPDLHHLLQLRRLLARGDVSSAEAKQALGSFLSRGVFDPEPHLMRAREWLSYILKRRDHVADRQFTKPGAPTRPTAAAAIPAKAPTPRSPAPGGRHPRARGPWVQGHGRSVLPAAEDRGSPPGEELAAPDAP
ncbi:hypothetical protein [Hyalangium minutum]|uniref:Uncharacterized protein n=1 Tax=Hyalangium minutum TaxID=394096 RepID=A0A085WPR9_9BACT|nr:hypothetical protein [Hyalangium minutum]KFE69682.1 hypothetical protein DB31_6657 [Hyalangium minutum]